MGRNAIQHWSERAFVKRLDTHGASDQKCWTPLPGQNVNPKQKIDWYDESQGQYRLTTIRRYLFEQVRAEELGGAALTWDDVLLQYEGCEPVCLNPWHLSKETRAGAAEAQRKAMARVSAGARRVTTEAIAYDAQADSERIYGRYLASRAVFIATRDSEAAEAVGRLEHERDEAVSLARKRAEAEHERLYDAIAASGRAASNIGKRKQILVHLFSLYPDIHEAFKAHGGAEQLPLSWDLD